MVNEVYRMRILRGKMALLRNGLGAAVFPPGIKALSLAYASKIDGGHMGPRKFWREFLPRLKFHNPKIPMEVKHTVPKGGPATLTIEFEGADKKPVVIDCLHKHQDDIIKQVIHITKAQQLPNNESDVAAVNAWEEEVKRRAVFEKEKMARREAAKEEEKNALGVGRT